MAEAATARPWVKSYPQGVPADIDVARVGTLVDLIRSAIGRYPDREAFESFGASMTFRQLGVAADAFAAALKARGFGRGDRIALMMPNVLAYPVALYGTLIAGCIVVNVNPLYTPRELAHQLEDSGASALVVLENFAHVAQQAVPQARTVNTVIVATAGDMMGLKGHVVNLVARYVKRAVPAWSIRQAIGFAAFLGMGKGASGAAQPPVGPDDTAFLQYTGGTTGVAKGATLTHRNVAANVAQVRAFHGAVVDEKQAHVMVTALPLYHIFALTCCCLYMAGIGAKCLLIANPRDIPGFLATLKKSRFTMMSGVNTLYNALVNQAEFKDINFGELVLCVAGGMATQAAVAKRWKEATGRPIVEGYGLSETSPVVTANRADIPDFTGTIGYPLPSTDVVIRDENGRDCQQGTPGELCVKGPQVMKGYWNRPDETAKVMTADGFFRTGDIAVLQPDGAFKIVDRIKDMILVSGFNVYPNEVEEVLATMPGILEAAVIGVPDEHSGEAVTAYVVKRDQSLTEAAVIEHCRTGLTGYKIPRHVVFRDALPKTNVGKVLRRALREEIKAKVSV